MELTTEQLKIQIRGAMINRRMSVPLRQAQAASSGLWSSLTQFPDFDKVRSIAAFVSARGEVPTELLLQSILESGRVLSLPRVDPSGPTMKFHQLERLRDLTPGAFGIMEPHPNLKVVDEKTVDLILVPGVAFDRKGGRVGFGKGFYDLSLPKFRPQTPRIGVGYAFQVLDAVPQVDKDQRVQWLLTDEGLIRSAL